MEEAGVFTFIGPYSLLRERGEGERETGVSFPPELFGDGHYEETIPPLKETDTHP